MGKPEVQPVEVRLGRIWERFGHKLLRHGLHVRGYTGVQVAQVQVAELRLGRVGTS